ncbi:Catenin-beta-like protein [Armillaria borealis]|uniref:Catenin-beta-like protein n=1 Tax=Armillaria borealis TaxID=47425 RepID=A0AA39K342_9AGAR|nr:Catenin-beta-like protein [Armillaria borealis]
MDIDKLFKTPKLPVGGGKRKLPDNPTPEMLKKMKMDTGAPSGSGHSPQNDSSQDKGKNADYFVEEDDEGRFFGGGLTSEQKEILNIFDNANEQEEPSQLSLSGIRRTLLQFERAVNKNQDQRSKYPDDPTKFIDSEADLDSAIKSLLPLAQLPLLSYPEIVKSGAVALLVGLLTHENVDIAIDVVEVFHELTDEDVGDEGNDDEEDTAEALKILIEGLLENSILELLVENLKRFNETEESDRQGVFHILGIFENVLGFDPALSNQLVSKTNFLPWLLDRIQAKTFDENRGYAAEILSILLQDSTDNRLQLGKHDGVETILKVLSQYRKRDPTDADEVEFMENVFDALCSALNETEIKKLFLAAEGHDLMILMMKEKLQSRSRSIKTLDYAMSGPSGTALCEAFIEALGLKSLFSIFMGNLNKKQKSGETPASEDTSHTLSIMASLFSNIPSDSTERMRLLTKFVENNYEKVDKLLDIRDSAKARLQSTDTEIVADKASPDDNDDMDEDSLYLRRLSGGLYTLQIVDYILAWIVMEDDGIRTHALQMLARRNQSLENIVETLRLYHDNVDNESGEPSEDQGPSRKEILEGLIGALDPNASAT